MSSFQFRAWPTATKVITQPFGANPAFYAQFGLPGHEGIDFAAALGSKVYAVASGTVEQVDAEGSGVYGIHLRIRHADGYATTYAHLQAVTVQEGQSVRTGQIVGRAGTTGSSNGPHLHLTLQQAGATFGDYPRNIIDPTPFLVALQNANGDDKFHGRSQGARSQSARNQGARSQSARSVAGFDFQGYNRHFISNTSGEAVNDAAGYDVGIHTATVATGETYWKVVGIHHLTPEENRSRHNIYVDVLDEAGNRRKDLLVGWNWEGNSGGAPEPKRLDKPDNEPGCDIPISEGTFKLWVMGEPSDEAFGFHYRHEDEPAANGELLNTKGHHSFYVVFQRARKGAVQPVDDSDEVVDVVITPPVEPIKEKPLVGVTLQKVFHRAAAKIGIDANAPIDEGSGQIGDQVNDPTIIAGAGVGWVRLNFIIGPWQDPHDQSRPFGRSWQETYRHIIDGFDRQGLKIYGLISDQALRDKPGGRLRSAPAGDLRGDGWIQRYANTFVTIVRMFGDKVTLFESFNEPDDWKRHEQPGWSDADPNWIHPGWFATILQAVYDAVRSDLSLNHIRLVSGPLQGLDVNNNAGAEYLRRTYEEGQSRYHWGQAGVPFPFDGVGYHLYIAEGAREQVRQAVQEKYHHYMTKVRDVIQAAEGVRKPIFISEIGWENPGDRDHLQQEAMNGAFDAILADETVALGIWFCTQDFPGKPYGLYRQGGLHQGQRKAIHDRLLNICNHERELTAVATGAAAESVPIIAPLTDGGTYVPDQDLILDGTVMQPGQRFVQGWTMRNSGQTVWGAGYKLVWVANESMGAPPQVNVPVCMPGNAVQIVVPFVTPTTAGAYKSTWRLCNDRGEPFGDPIWVLITVAETRQLAPLPPAALPPVRMTEEAAASHTLLLAGIASTQRILAQLDASLATGPTQPLADTLTLAALGVTYHAYWSQIAGLTDGADRAIIAKDAAATAIDSINALLHEHQGRGGGSVPAAASPLTSLSSVSPGIPAIAHGGAGRKRALCIGIDDYAQQPLAGCVADARLWVTTLVALGFEPPKTLFNREATRHNMLQALQDLVQSSRAGDVLVFQYAGHGIQLPDLDGDEHGGDTPEKDEAFVPYDFLQGAYVIDDDLAAIFSQIPAGVNVTCFIDCCHSGTISRAPLTDRDERPRFLVADAAMIAAHRQYRQRIGDDRKQSRSLTKRTPEAMREVVFSACQSTEVAWESNGHGEFTLRATSVLQAGLDGLSHEAYLQRILAAFGANPRQRPLVDCAPTRLGGGLLQAVPV